uniref:Uncharacterized protein n=1 Tax=Avena sativa TaxID=4498 RepID=A0ACD5VCU5_AVESA
MSPKYDLTDAQGMDSALRRRMPDFQSVSIAESCSPAVLVGRWYVPFMFVKADGDRSLKDQFRRCTFYEMTMDQSWAQICTSDNPGHDKPADVRVTVTVRPFAAQVDGTSMVQEGWPQAGGGAVWFRPAAPAAAMAATVALDTVVWERMMWELEREGWVANGDQERIERVERRDSHWHKFACYVLLERFRLKRMDGSLALTCEFLHTDKIKPKWL